MAEARPSPGEQVVNALKLVADVGILPGTSRLVDGAVGEGVLYALVGVATKLALVPLLGPLGFVAAIGVGLDSFSKSASGKHLWQLPASDQRPTPTSQASGAPVAP
jgi:hypothetical protein